MGEDDPEVEAAEPDSPITLHDFYKSTQAHLIRTTERSLDLDKKDLARSLDDVLLRQRFWEDDIQLEEGALSVLEANDAVASSIIRRYLDEIMHLLYDIDRIPSEPLSNTNNEKEKMALLYETNARLCDQVEIFDANAANDTVDAAGTAIGRLRRQLEEENEMLQSRARSKVQAASVLSLSEESGSQTGSLQSEMSSKKRKISGPTPSSAEAGPIVHASAIEDKPPVRAHSVSGPTYWFCSECLSPNNKELSPQKCSICGHTRCAQCGLYI